MISEWIYGSVLAKMIHSATSHLKKKRRHVEYLDDVVLQSLAGLALRLLLPVNMGAEMKSKKFRGAHVLLQVGDVSGALVTINLKICAHR